MCPCRRNYITSADLRPFLTDDQVKEAMEVFDVDKNDQVQLGPLQHGWMC